MATADLRSRSLRALPVACLAVLVVWTGWDVLRVDLPRPEASAEALLVVAFGAFLVFLGKGGPWPRRLGILLLGSTYFVVRIFVHGIDLVPALLFLALAIVGVELQILSDRFAPVYARSLTDEEGRRVDAALARSFLRLGVAALLAVLVPILAADLAVSGAFGVTTIPTAFLLGVGVAAIVAFLALLPSRARRSDD